MNMLGHDDVSGNEESVIHSRAFESKFEDTACRWSSEQRLTVVTTEGDEMKVVRLLVAVQSPGHGSQRRLSSWVAL
jgi:hypothetical protein